MGIRPPIGARAARRDPGALAGGGGVHQVVAGAPDGEYVVIQYATDFERKPNAIDTVTPMRETDRWSKVSGYFIK